jgi:hypothetical protein
MFKTLVLALCGVLASAAQLQIPMEAFMKVAPKESLVKMQLHGSRLGSTASGVTWSECPSLHLYDVATGTASPNPPIVGDFVGLNLDVIFNNDANVVGNYIYVAFTAEGSSSPIALYAQDFNS